MEYDVFKANDKIAEKTEKILTSIRSFQSISWEQSDLEKQL